MCLPVTHEQFLETGGGFSMVDVQFQNKDQENKRKKLTNIITAKARGISYEHLQMILDSVDLGKQYTITGTSDMRSLLRNAYNEEGLNFSVRITVIYGLLNPGMLSENIVVSEPAAEMEPTAFLKEIRIESGESLISQYALFVFQPELPVLARCA